MRIEESPRSCKSGGFLLVRCSATPPQRGSYSFTQKPSWFLEIQKEESFYVFLMAVYFLFIWGEPRCATAPHPPGCHNDG